MPTPRSSTSPAASTCSASWCTPIGEWVASKLDNQVGDFRFLTRARCHRFTTAFDQVFKTEGIRVLLTAPQAHRLNAIMERCIGSVRRELPDRTLIVDERHLHKVLAEYETHSTSTPAPAPDQGPVRNGAPSYPIDIDVQFSQRPSSAPWRSQVAFAMYASVGADTRTTQINAIVSERGAYITYQIGIRTAHRSRRRR